MAKLLREDNSWSEFAPVIPQHKRGESWVETGTTNPLPTQSIDLGGVVQDSWEGTANVTRTLPATCNRIALVNDGDKDITIEIGNLRFKVRAGESFSESFKPFTSVKITTTVAYRAMAMGGI